MPVRFRPQAPTYLPCGVRLYLDIEQQQRLLSAAKNSKWDKFYLLLLMTLTTGARRSEIMKLTYNQVFNKKDTITCLDTKNGTDKVLILTDQVKTELERFRSSNDHLLFGNPKKPLEIINFKQNGILMDLSYIKSTYRALELFFELVDINCEHVTKWIDIPLLDEIPKGVDRKYLTEVTEHPEYVNEIKNQFMSFWRGPRKSD